MNILQSSESSKLTSSSANDASCDRIESSGFSDRKILGSEGRLVSSEACATADPKRRVRSSLGSLGRTVSGSLGWRTVSGSLGQVDWVPLGPATGTLGLPCFGCCDWYFSKSLSCKRIKKKKLEKNCFYQSTPKKLKMLSSINQTESNINFFLLVNVKNNQSLLFFFVFFSFTFRGELNWLFSASLTFTFVIWGKKNNLQRKKKLKLELIVSKVNNLIKPYQIVFAGLSLRHVLIEVVIQNIGRGNRSFGF